MAVFTLDRVLVKEFIDGTLDPRGEAALAEQVAGVLPFHEELHHSMAADLLRVIDHLGGDAQLLRWLDRHPGRPRLIGRIFSVVGVLDNCSANPAVVNALREYRERIPAPPGLERYIPPHTDDDTLASLAYRIETLLRDEEADEAVRASVAAVDVLRDVVATAALSDPELRELVTTSVDLRRAVLEAAQQAS
jgi:hypothetical protein